MRIILLTGVNLRHRYFANRIAQECGYVVAVFREEESPEGTRSEPTGERAELDRAILRWHFGLRDHTEEMLLGDVGDQWNQEPGCELVTVKSEDLNTANVAQNLKSYSPDVVAVFGTSILRTPILGELNCFFLNLHLGLSQYYRGVATNFWATYNDELEYVGATIHLIDTGTDTGPILHQGRPEIVPDDDQHTIGTKALIVGTDLMIKTLAECREGRLKWRQATDKGRLYRRKDFKPYHARKLREKLNAGLIPRYIAQSRELKSKVDIIQ